MPGARSIITIGNFDGVHLGHAALIHRAVEHARRHTPALRAIVMSFDPHPASALRPDRPPPPRLTGFERRTELLRGLGADEVVRLTPDRSLLDLSAEEFVRRIVADHAPAMFVEGQDFHFGRGRSGNVGVLAELGRTLGFGVDVVHAVEAALTDQLIVPASSTIARWLIAQGRVRDTAIVLGRPHSLVGTVVQGDQRGRTIGFPTANLRTDLHLPADGVYAAIATLPDGARRTAAVNVGTRPTFAGTDRRVEAHILDSKSGEIPDGYGWPLEIAVVGWIRDQVKFDGVDRLREQLARDCRRARAIVENPHVSGVNPHPPVTDQSRAAHAASC